MKFGQALEQEARADWAAHYVNYKRAKARIKEKADVPQYKTFIMEECNRVESFYRIMVEELKRESEALKALMNQSGSVEMMVNRSWKHTEDLGDLYDFGRLNHDGVRKSLKKYDKTFLTQQPKLQSQYLEELKTQYKFFSFREDLKDLLFQCAIFWNEDATKLRGLRASEIREVLPASFPLAGQLVDQKKMHSSEETETEAESDDEDKGRKAGQIKVPQTEAEKDEQFEQQYTHQRLSKPEWNNFLADYQKLNNILKELAKIAGVKSAFAPVASLSMSDHPAAAYGAAPEIIYEGKRIKEDDWFKLVDKEVEDISKVTDAEVTRVRSGLVSLRDRCEGWSKKTKDKSAAQTGARASVMLQQLGALEQEAKQLGSDFLSLEKFVNLNFQAFEKLLKNHDRLLPNTPCHQFYMSKLRNQGWIRNDFSDVFVTLSDCHSLLRQDSTGQQNTDAKQDFVRNTKKYWVATEHVSSVKHLILQHLPVFKMSSGGGDSQLINSVYFDNRQMQLYHGRMDKTPGAIALRLRWYGTECNPVFVERKTHLDAWTGNVSVKERFTIDEELCVPFLNGSYTVNEYADEMRRQGKKEADIQSACKLFSQVARAIESKQLGPTVRTQYMRTAFQIPFDASVRISLDTNLCMVREDCCGYASTITERWRRDERVPVKASELTHFPHAVLEVKLQGDVENPPVWVKDLLEGGWCTEVYKFSKFIHGSAVLLTELVAAAPYWIDDVSIRDSVNASAPKGALTKRGNTVAFPGAKADDDASSISFGDGVRKERRANEDEDAEEAHPLLGQMRPTGNQKGARATTDFLGRQTPKAPRNPPGDVECTCCGLIQVEGAGTLPRKVPVRIEPKTFFANERTFLAWLHMSVTLGGISSALTVFADNDSKEGAGVQIMSLALTLVAAMFILHASHSFYIRRLSIRKREDAGLDQIAFPIFIGCTLVVSLLGILIANFSESLGPAPPPHNGTNWTLLALEQPGPIEQSPLPPAHHPLLN